MGSISPTCLREAFTSKDSISIKIQSSCQYLLVLLGSLGVKALHKMLMKLTPEFSASVLRSYVEYATCLNLQSKMIIFELSLTIVEANTIS